MEVSFMDGSCESIFHGWQLAAINIDLPSHCIQTAVMEAIKTGEELLQAARQGDVKAVTTLLQHRSGNMAWIKDSAGWTPLHVAAFKGHLQVVTRLLLEDGGKTALQSGDAEGHTPLHCAAEGGNIKVVELLLAMGADPRAVSCRGATAADLAKAFGFTTIAKLIEHYACTTYGVHAHHNNDVTIRRASTSKELKPLHRRSISPSPNVDHRRLSASDVRFSTPTKLHDNSCRQHQSSMAYYSGRTSDNKKSSADATRQHHNRLQQSTPKNLLLLEMLPQSGREPEVKFEHDSKLPSIISMPSNTLKPTENETLFSEVGARIARQKHQINTQHTSPHSSFRKLEHSGEKQNVAQSRRSKPGIQEENDSIYTPLHNKDKGDINTNRPTPCQRTPRLTLATLLGKARGSRMGLNSMLEKVTQNKSTESILQVPANQIEHQHILMVGNQNLNAFSLRKKSRSMSTELYMSDSDAIPTDERRNVSTELHVANSGMGPKDKRNIIGISSKEEHRLSVMIPPQNVKLTPCSSMDKEQEKHRIKESTDLYNKVKYEMSDKSSPRLQLHHHTTEKTQKHFNLVASRNTICTEGLKHTNEIIENPPLAIAATEPNIRLVSDGTTDLGIHGQRIISSASRSNQGIGQNTMMEESADSLQDSLPELLPQSLQVEMNVFRDNEVSIKHSLGQLDFSTGDSSDDENIMTMDKFPVTPSAACESIIDSDVGEKQSALASACISSTTSSAKIKDPHEHSILRDFQVFRDLSKSPAGPQVEKALTTMASSLADETSPNLHIQNISDVQVVSAEHALKVSLERTMTNADGIFGTHQDIPSISKPDRVKETKSSFNGPNMPTYAPPLRIKQMKKSVSVPMVKNSNPNNDIDAEAPENLLVQEDKVRQSLKPRSLIFKEIFR
ncbi:hypothetical protein KP509_33G051000 [Ceratopteris richardii]|uniref:Uncharacterized protein n=1 Tax=Ceratopteris richardii TaxID=49495 RepID=A0A8T2QPL0_CERRI|nr:hypothetical protein KP509_33G051000 [Ceratopteris richardii]